MKKILLFVMLSVLTACVIPQPAAGWYKHGVSQEDTRTKYSRCVYDIGMNKVDPIQQQTLINACMEADGFRWGVREGY